MNHKIFVIGLLILLFSIAALDFPFDDDVSSILEVHTDCQKGTGDMRAAFLMALGHCEPSEILYYSFLLSAFIGLIVLIVGLLKKQPYKKTGAISD